MSLAFTMALVLIFFLIFHRTPAIQNTAEKVTRIKNL